MGTRHCVLCSTRDRDGNEREPNWAHIDEYGHAWQVCKSHAERFVRLLEVVPYQHAILSAAPGSGTGQARVSGSGEQPLGVRVPVLDLIGPANVGMVHDDYGDQDGMASAASILAAIVDDWAHYRGKGEQGPVRKVPDLARWLADRADWAVTAVEVDDAGDRTGGGHPALDDAWHDLNRLAAALRAANGDLPDDPIHKDGVECPRCDRMTLYDTVDFVECLETEHGCGRLMSPAEYWQWCEMKSYFLRTAIPCPQCGCCTLTGARKIGRSECVLAKGGCGAVLEWPVYEQWAKAVAAVEKAGLLVLGTHYPLPGPSSLSQAA